MSIETENNFINELRFDILKDKFKSFLFNNISKLIILIILLIIFLLSYLFINMYKNNKIEKNNNKIYLALISDDKKSNLEKIYNDELNPEITRTLAAFKLVDLYDDYENKKKFLDYIYKNSKDNFFKYYAGISIFTIEINNENINRNYINSLIEELENKDNPLINIFLEQKAIFLMKDNKNDDAKKILEKLLISNENDIFKSRISTYLKNVK